MTTLLRYRGVDYDEQKIEEVRRLISANPDRSRFFISKELCRLWNWTQANGTPRDMLCRSLLLKLHAEGHIALPPRKRVPEWLSRRKKGPVRIEVDDSSLEAPLAELLPLTVPMVRRTPLEKLYRSLIREHHYLGYTQPVGEHLEYIAFSQERPVACIGWCSAPRHIGCRDRHLGWEKEQRIANLHKIAVNTRFLILPWVRVPHLASHLLGRMAHRISDDWERTYAHPIVWLETFVDPERGYKGTCYKAANWRRLGLTTGRGKSDQAHKPNRSLKNVFGYPLEKDYKKALYGVL
jgi:Domain of unknown function (DUF4338)